MIGQKRLSYLSYINLSFPASATQTITARYGTTEHLKKPPILRQGEIVDTIDSYLGFRTVSAHEGEFFLNGKPVWLNGALDQGCVPDRYSL